MKTGCLELLPLIVNSMGSHLVQCIVEPPTAVTRFEHGIRSEGGMFICDMCSKFARQMLAPLSGKTLCKVGDDFWCLGRQGKRVMLMSSILLDDLVEGFGSMMLRADSVFVVVPESLVIFCCRHTRAKWFIFPQLWQSVSHAGQCVGLSRLLCVVDPQPEHLVEDCFLWIPGLRCWVL